MIDFNYTSISVFTKEQFNEVVRQAIPITIFVGVASLSITFARALAVAVTDPPSLLAKLTGLLTTVFYGLVAILIFTASTVSNIYLSVLFKIKKKQD